MIITNPIHGEIINQIRSRTSHLIPKNQRVITIVYDAQGGPSMQVSYDSDAPGQDVAAVVKALAEQL